MPILVCTPSLPTYLHFILLSILLVFYQLLQRVYMSSYSVTHAPSYIVVWAYLDDVLIIHFNIFLSATTWGRNRFLFCYLNTLMCSSIKLSYLFKILNSWSLILLYSTWRNYDYLFLNYKALELCVMYKCEYVSASVSVFLVTVERHTPPSPRYPLRFTSHK